MLLRACKTKNWGDTLNSELMKLISGQVPTIINDKFHNGKGETIYMMIGSVLGWADENTEVWGSGFIQEGQIIEKPKKIYAVRGELTREELIKQGHKCPKVYGDPALLLPRFYNPTIEKKYELSIILHHVDKELKPILKKKYKNVNFIDVQQDIYAFIDEVCASEKIASSSLHGLIASDAYNIPNIWIQVSDKILGEGFKFRDYFSSIKRQDTTPLIINDKVPLGLILDKLKRWNKPEINLDKLWSVCPFRQKGK